MQWELQQQESRSRRDVDLNFMELPESLISCSNFHKGQRGGGGGIWRFLRRGIATARTKKYKECETKRKVQDLDTNFMKPLELTISFLVDLIFFPLRVRN